MSNDCVRFFSFVEEEIRKATESGHITKINCNKLTEILVERVDVVSSFSAMEEGPLCEMDKETKKNLIEKLIQPLTYSITSSLLASKGIFICKNQHTTSLQKIQSIT